MKKKIWKIVGRKGFVLPEFAHGCETNGCDFNVTVVSSSSVIVEGTENNKYQCTRSGKDNTFSLLHVLFTKQELVRKKIGKPKINKK